MYKYFLRTEQQGYTQVGKSYYHNAMVGGYVLEHVLHVTDALPKIKKPGRELV